MYVLELSIQVIKPKNKFNAYFKICMLLKNVNKIQKLSCGRFYSRDTSQNNTCI